MSTPIEINPKHATASIILLHGLGADGNDLLPIAEILAEDYIRFIVPDAPVRPISLYPGQSMPAWFDLAHTDLRLEQDQSGLDASRAVVNALIEKEMHRNISAERIVLAGFSQGGALALYSGLTLGWPLAGIVGLSTWLPTLTPFLPIPPLWLAHGSADNVVPLHTSLESYALLAEAQSALHVWPIAHQITPVEFKELKAWLLRQLPRHGCSGNYPDSVTLKT